MSAVVSALIALASPAAAQDECGDANEDQSVTATDALIALQAAVGSATCEECRCDTLGQNGISASDALLILQFAVGQPVMLDCPVCAGEPDSPDPFLGQYVLEDAAEIALATQGLTAMGANSGMPAHRIYDVPNSAGTPPQTSLDLCGLQLETAAPAHPSRSDMDIMVADVNGDEFVDIVSVWEGEMRAIGAILPALPADGVTLACGGGMPDMWTESNPVTLHPGGSAMMHRMNLRLEPANVDADQDSEFVVAYWAGGDCDPDCPIHVEVYDTHGTLTPELVASIADRSMPLGQSQARFDITTGDVDFDSKSEVILVHYTPSSFGNRFDIFVQIYDVEVPLGSQTLELVPAASGTTTYSQSSSAELERLGVDAGDFDNDSADELVLAFQVREIDQPTIAYLQTFEALLQGDPLAPFDLTLDPDDPGDGDVFDTPGRVEGRQLNGDSGFSLQVLAADLNNDTLDEVLLFALGSGRIFEPVLPAMPQDPPEPIVLSSIRNFGSGGRSADDHHRFIGVANLNLNFSGLIETGDLAEPEIVVAGLAELDDGGGNITYPLQFSVDTVEDVTLTDGVISAVALRRVANLTDSDFEGELSETRPLALALGDFDQDNIRLGRPSYSRVSGLLQPLALINAPPVHFDFLDGMAVDVSDCFSGNPCDSSIRYEVMDTMVESFLTQTTADWAVDASLGAGGSAYGVTVEAKISAKYGQAFSQTQGITQTAIATTTVPTSRDDLIFASITDYDIWEYPVFDGMENQGYLVAVIPRSSQELFSPSKNIRDFAPSHEFGNWLSYPELPSLTSVDDFIMAFGRPYDVTRAVGGTGFTLTSTGDSPQWVIQTVTEQEIESQGTITRGIGASVNIEAGITVEVSGEYTDTEVTTHKNSFTHSESLEVFMGTVTGIGQAVVTPFIYWSDRDVLIIEYAVEPPGFGDAFWAPNYSSEPDPAFILPWRYDEMKMGVNALPEPAFVERTKDIRISPANAKPGDRVTLTAVVRNFSLLDTMNPVVVKFYDGDPDNGGTLLIGTLGETMVETEERLVPRGSSTSTMEWDIPSDRDLDTLRIYATIELQGMDVAGGEIHTNNNKGWADIVDSVAP